MRDDDQATFVFMHPDQEQQRKDQELVKETVQQALIAYRQSVNQTDRKAANAEKERVAEKETKSALLKNEKIFDLYKHLVREKFISPQDFWAFYIKPDEARKESEPTGISAGFLSSIIQPDPSSRSGIRVTLTMDTIQAIFKTYPAVEKKHLELVPHEMTEEDFWRKFLESHYIHYRDRSAEAGTNPLDPCEKMDEEDMRSLIEREKGSLKRHLDLSQLDEDLGIISEMRSNQMPLRGHSAGKAALLRRFNFHSERVLNSSKMAASNDEFIPASLQNGGNLLNGNGIHAPGQNEQHIFAMNEQFPSTSGSSMPSSTDHLSFQLESHELAEVDSEEQRLREEFVPLVLNNLSSTDWESKRARSSTEAAAENERLRQFGLSMIAAAGSIHDLDEKGEKGTFNAIMDIFAGNMLDDRAITGRKNPWEAAEDDDEAQLFKAAGLNTEEEILSVYRVHSRLAELLRHFWACFPPSTVELRKKLQRMQNTLTLFETEQLAKCEEVYGPKSVEHCHEMLEKARQKFTEHEALIRSDSDSEML